MICQQFRRRPYTPPGFEVVGFYKFVRHPLLLGSTPTNGTEGRPVILARRVSVRLQTVASRAVDLRRRLSGADRIPQHPVVPW